MIREKPILFSEWSVRRILTCAKCGKISVPFPCEHCGSTEFCKTQTRRVMKKNLPLQNADGDWEWYPGGEAAGYHALSPDPKFDMPQGWAREWCPYGGPGLGVPGNEPAMLNYPGDLLVPRTTWAIDPRWDKEPPRNIPDDANIWSHWCGFPKPEWCGKSRPGRFMPKRLWRCLPRLENTGVKVERSQEISEEDAKAEGIEKSNEPSLLSWPWLGADHPIKGTPKVFPFAVQAYRSVWESINVPGSWDRNEFVWAVTFSRIHEKSLP